ncbi:MAG: hypothetical protein KF767_06620 [Bdellovibrionaceae bacterium]|nr:hypothetical protein [Pseudobdellovibrionaceae bacterium]
MLKLLIKSLLVTFFVALSAFVLPAGAQTIGARSQNTEDTDDGHGHDLTVDALVDWKAFDAKAPWHKVFALIRKDGHSMNRPFVLEIRAACREYASQDWSALKVGDQESLCGVDPSSLRLDGDAVVIEYVEPDAEFYKEQIGKRVKKIKQRCLKERKTLRLSLQHLCKP